MADRRLLLLSPESPWPPYGGGAMRTYTLLEYFRRHYGVDLVVFRDPSQPDPRASIPPDAAQQVVVLELPVHSRHLWSRGWRNLRRLARGAVPLVDRFAGFESQLATLLAGRSYDVGIIEHFWCAPYVTVLRPLCRRLVLNLHNIESRLLESSAAIVSPPLRIALQRFADHCRDAEKLYLGQFDLLLATSAADAACLPTYPTAVVPNALPSWPVPCVEKDHSLVFSANFAYAPNHDAVSWFSRSIWPEVADNFPNLRWRLVGRGVDSVVPLLSASPRIEWTGPIDDALSAIARSNLAVVPLRAGSGTRFKILEAWAAGVPVVSTSLGCEGLQAISGTDLLIADDARSFVDAIVLILKDSGLCERLSRSARIKFESQYSWNAAWRALEEAGF